MAEPVAHSSFHLRAFTFPDDIAPLLGLLADAEAVDQSGEDISEATIQAQLAVRHHDPARDRYVVAHSTDPTRMIAQSALWTAATMNEQIISEMSLVVHPQWRQRGIGAALLHRNMLRAQELDAEYIRLYADPQHTPTVQFLLHHRFASIATYAELRAATCMMVPDLPTGFVIKPYASFHDLPTLVDAFNHSYAGLWGHHQVSPAELQQWLPDLDLDGLFVLFAPNGSVAGMCRAEQHAQRTARNGQVTGYIDAPGVIARYRTPQLYGALLAQAMRYLGQQVQLFELESWGDSSAILTLYQTLGFAIARQQYAYQRALKQEGA